MHPGDFPPHRRPRVVPSTKAPQLMHSPDSVMAFNAGISAIEGETASGSPCGVIGIILSPSSQSTAHQPATSSSSSSTVHSSLPSASCPQTTTKKTTSTTVVNPYIKVTPSASTIAVDPRLLTRRKFVDKYRMQTLPQYGNGGRQHNITQNSISCRVDPMAVESPISAWEMHCATQHWRHAWQYPEQATTCKQNHHSIPTDMPLRPRLFLIRHRSEIQQLSRHQNSHLERPTSQPRHQNHHDGGIWELGNGITELSGEGGSGKTQICLSLCVTCVMMRPIYYQSSTSTDFGNQSGIDARLLQNNEHYMALYISMGEGIQSTTAARRLEQMVQSRLHRPYPNNQAKQILSRIGLIALRNEEDFVQFVDHELPNILQDQKYHHRRQQHRSQQQQSSKIALIVFDGIAGFFRFSDPLFQQFQKNNSTFHRQRGSRLLHISSQLRGLSDLHDVPILITNQVTAAIPSSDSPSISGTPSGDQVVVPALGLAWSNCVSTRCILQRKDEMMATVSSENCREQNEPILAKRSSTLVRVRVARILQAVNMPQEREARFVIETEGVSAVA